MDKLVLGPREKHKRKRESGPLSGQTLLQHLQITRSILPILLINRRDKRPPPKLKPQQAPSLRKVSPGVDRKLKLASLQAAEPTGELDSI